MPPSPPPTPGDASAAVRCEGLRKSFGPVRAVDGLDLVVRTGETIGLLGPNGAGKTTTVEILEGLTAPDAGRVELFGVRWGAGRDRSLRARIGVQLQETRLDDWLTVLETLRLFRSFHRRGRQPEEVIRQVGLGEKRDAQIRRLSGGQHQRLALACALVGAPELLFLDEPTTGLDPQARRRIWEIVEAFRAAGGTTVLTTHYMEEAARLCDRVAIMDRGRILALDTPDALIHSLGARQVVEFALDDETDPEWLGELPGVHGVQRRGPLFVLTVADTTETLPALLGELRARRAPLRTLATHHATLEDVFVAMTGKALRDE